MYRVVWQHNRRLVRSLAEVPPAPAEVADEISPLLADLETAVRVEPVFPVAGPRLRGDLLRAAEAVREDPANDLAGYFHTFVEDPEEALLLSERLLDDPRVDYADVEGRPREPIWVGERTPPAPAETAPRPTSPEAAAQPPEKLDSHQGHLGAGGVDARAVWGVAGATGAGINVVDVEYGWNLGHEDLLEKLLGRLDGPEIDRDHGTAALGVLSADDNGRGVLGIAHGAWAGGASISRPGGQWNVAGAVYEAGRRLSRGHVILLEVEVPVKIGSGSSASFHWLPAEYLQDEFVAIRWAARERELLVVEPAGNDSRDLDSSLYGRRFSRQERDSGAIVVGAGASASDTARSRLAFSNFGSRVDLQGWGEDVATCGGRSKWYFHDLHDDPDASRCYTRSFSGTSSASAIVAGVVACVSGALRAAGRDPLTSVEMRQLLAETGRPQTGTPPLENIGSLPYLPAALGRLGLT